MTPRIEVELTSAEVDKALSEARQILTRIREDANQCRVSEISSKSIGLGVALAFVQKAVSSADPRIKQFNQELEQILAQMDQLCSK